MIDAKIWNFIAKRLSDICVMFGSWKYQEKCFKEKEKLGLINCILRACFQVHYDCLSYTL